MIFPSLPNPPARESTEVALLETLLWEPQVGFFLLDRHLQRLRASARALGFQLDLARVRDVLSGLSEVSGGEPKRVRLTVSRVGDVRAQLSKAPAAGKVRVAWALTAVDSSDGTLCHKTTMRARYERARAGRPEVDDVLLWNERGEATETTTGNLVLELDGNLYTPPLSAGLLPGTFRGFLLERGKLEERSLGRADVERAPRLYQINSVRKWCELELVRPVAQ